MKHGDSTDHFGYTTAEPHREGKSKGRAPMDQQIKDRYNDTILQEAMRRYGIANDKIKPLDAFESFIYEFERSTENYILRINHSLRKSEALIQGEVDWINYLTAGGVSAARAIRSETGKLVEAIDDGQGGQFLVTAFVKAQGQRPWEAGWTPTRYETYGNLLGRMHALAETYESTGLARKRPEWDDESMKFVESYLPASEIIAKQKYYTLLEHIYTLPKDSTTYGLIHQDAHQNNFFMDEDGQITLFDFDECAYSWFINDVAIVLFYISMDAEELGFPTAAAFTQEFMTLFLRGYGQAYALDPKWLKEIPNFLKLRELELYAVVYRDFDVNNIDDVWIANFMQDRKTRIEQDIPFIDFDFETLSISLNTRP
jgi:amicoumacin kinase